MKRDYHVTWIGSVGMWQVQLEGARDSRTWKRSQREAIEIARRRAKRRKCEVVIHRKDGTIRDSDTYGREGKAKDRKH